ncbi:phosphotransferase enzyme family protein [Nocardia spumae]|uniref:phosphotransferase enzyme family protein n=1 Tax=Nocardia spumae TaxID=2887190 RepID=UPI001D14D271|nr:phosphotransferase [Nocardia spumae]
MTAGEPDTRVFAMGETGLVAPDFPALSATEAAAVLDESGVARIEWRSRRPLSSTARVRRSDGTAVVVKRMPSALRDPETLAPEHDFADHLRVRGIPIPRMSSVRRGAFTYEIQELGIGADRYRDEFSWSPYHSVPEAVSAGAMLARLHLAAIGFEAPQRPPHPLLAAVSTDAVRTIEQYIAARPEVGRFLADLDWRSDWERPLPDDRRHAGGELARRIAELPPLWTHNDWHPTNLLWTGAEVSSVLDFGLANRTVAIFDLATAIERFAVDWLAPVPHPVRADQLRAFLRGYNGIRPLEATERELLPDLFPLVHVAYELSEMDYFLTIPPRRQVRRARIAYRNYFLGRSAWAASAEGKAFTTMLRRLTAECC